MPNDNANTLEVDTIKVWDKSGEGILSGSSDSVSLTSRGVIKVLDLLGEGEIEGLVSGEYIPYGDNNYIGNLGYQNVRFDPYPTGSGFEAFLRSVYLNEVPIINTNNIFNFQKVDIAETKGTPEGIRSGDKFLRIGLSNNIENTRSINEKLYGPDKGRNATDPWVHYPKVYRFFNKYLKKIRVNIKVPSLSYTKNFGSFPLDDVGKTVGTSINFKLRFRPIYTDGVVRASETGWFPSSHLSYTIKGLVRSEYIYKAEIDVYDQNLLRSANSTNRKISEPEKLSGWEVEITRTTLDSIESHVSNQTFVESITEINEDLLSYPNSAIVSLNFDAEYFSQIPNRSYDVRLLKVKIPLGYDPITRRYSSEWNGEFQKNGDGTFKKQWTDNPAWIFYDLLTNKRYGLGRFIEEINIDKWTLYEISKYCDVLVSNGEGGVEPRFSCNTLINTREDAFKVIQDFASCFRSIVYYGFGSIQTIQDKPKEEIAQFTNSNVENGDFSYTSSNRKNRTTVCLVRYNDKRNLYKPAIEYVEDVDGIRKYGILEKEITSFACTSKSQAIRLGRWILTTESAQTEMVSFVAGTEGLLLRPGDVIRIADENRALENHGGRVINYNSANSTNIIGITLDKNLALDSNKNYTLFLTTPSFFYDTSLVDGMNSSLITGIRKSHVQSFVFSPSSNFINVGPVPILDSVDGEFVREKVYGTQINYNNSNLPMFENSLSSGSLVNNAVWTLIDNDYSNNQYVITSIKEGEDFKYNVEAAIYEPQKYSFIESGIAYSTSPISSPVTLQIPPAPEDVSLYLGNYSENTRRVDISIRPPTDVGSTYGYKIFLKRDSTFGSEDTVSPASSLPKEEFYLQTVFLSDRPSSTDDLVVSFVPFTNDKTYYVRVFSLNSSSMLSNDYREDNIFVNNHFPIRDVKVNSLRLQIDEVDETANSEALLHREVTSKDAAVKWDTSLLNLESSIIGNLSLSYRIRIHPANLEPSETNFVDEHFTEEKFFDYTFALNALSEGGPRRTFILTVEAIDDDGESSSSGFTRPAGWDSIRIDNPKPTNYFLTPRKDQGRRAGDQIACDKITTEQYITADGLIKLNLRNNSFLDLAGGYIYLSKFPFSGNDFINGRPKELINRTNIYNGLSEQEKIGMAGAGVPTITGQYQILEIPFEAAENETLKSEILVNPSIILKNNNFNFNYSNNYYMAVKFYDSFDREIKNANSGNTEIGDWVKEYTGLHIGFARDNVNAISPLGYSTNINDPVNKTSYSFSQNVVGNYLGGYTSGIPSCVTGTFSCPIYPTKYFSAGAENGFRYWIRINVNGQWEGNGISHVKILNAEDVRVLYNDYKGFYEYSCVSKDRPQNVTTNYVGAPNYTAYPNDSYTKCRFRQGVYSTDTTISHGWLLDKVVFGYRTITGTGATAGNLEWNKTNGTTRFGQETYKRYFWNYSYKKGQIVFDLSTYEYYFATEDIAPRTSSTASISSSWRRFTPTQKAGIGYGGYGLPYGNPSMGVNSQAAYPGMDKIDSYNEKNIVIAGKSRPLRGFRRYRVYFDENNLPPKSKTNGLASYSIVGINCWNGHYEAWKSNPDLPVGRASTLTGLQGTIVGLYSGDRLNAELEQSILYAKDGIDAFSFSTMSWLRSGDLFENIPGVWNHHSAGFGAGFGGLHKGDRYFDVHLGRLIDDSYLNEAFFGVVSTNDYTISETMAWLPAGFSPEQLHEASWQTMSGYVTLPLISGGDTTSLN